MLAANGALGIEQVHKHGIVPFGVAQRLPVKGQVQHRAGLGCRLRKVVAEEAYLLTQLRLERVADGWRREESLKVFDVQGQGQRHIRRHLPAIEGVEAGAEGILAGCGGCGDGQAIEVTDHLSRGPAVGWVIRSRRIEALRCHDSAVPHQAQIQAIALRRRTQATPVEAELSILTRLDGALRRCAADDLKPVSQRKVSGLSDGQVGH